MDSFQNAKPLPSCERSESTILSIALQEQDKVADLIEAGIQPTDFVMPHHGTICSILYEFYEREEPLDLVLFAQVLKDRGIEQNMGGFGEIQKIYTFASTSANLEHHIKKVKDRALRRRVIIWSHEVEEAAYDAGKDVFDMLTEPVSKLLEEKDPNQHRSTGQEIAIDWFNDWESKIQGQTMDVIPCGVMPLDNLRGGIDNPGLTYIGAFPSTGKTAMLVQFICYLIRNFPDSRVLFFSLEMTRRQIFNRAMMHLCGFDDPSVIVDPKRENVTKKELETIRDMAKLLSTDRLIVDDTPGLSIDKIASRVKLERRRGPLTLIGVDFIQLVQAKESNVEQRLTRVSEGLQRIMKSTEASVVGLSQLTKADGRIKYKYAESVEEHADLALRIEREREEDEVKGIQVVKDRQRGTRGEFMPCEFDKKKQIFVERSGSWA